VNDSVTVIDIVAQVTDETDSGRKSAEQSLSKLERSIMNLQKQIQGMKGKSKLEVLATLKDMASKGLQGVAAAGKKIAGKVWTVTLKAIDFVTAPFKKVIGLISSPITQAAAFAGVSLGVADTISTFKDFEQGMANVKAISGATGEEFTALETTAKKLGETTMFSAAQAAGAMENLAMAGWKSKDIVAGMPGLLDLAAAGSVDLATAADVTASALAQFRLSADESTRVADVLAATATNSKTDVTGLGESLKYAGSLAGALGYSLEDVSVALGVMGNAAIDGSSAGTALRSMLARMSKQEGLTAEESGAVAKAMKKVGVSLTDEEGKGKSLMTVLRELRSGFEGLSDSEQSATAANLAGQYAMSGLLAIVNASEEDFVKLENAINNSGDAAAEMAGIKMDTLQGSLYYLQSAAEGVKIAIGEKLNPYVRGLVDWVTAHMPDIQNAVGEAVDFVTGKIDDVAASVRELTASSEWRSAETLWEKIKLAWDRIIVEPFAQWWNGTGKAWLAGAAESIGGGLGSALHDGVLGILGIDLDGAAEDGLSVGKAFGKAFAEGFNGAEVGEAIAAAIKEGLKGIALDASTLLPGGEKASGTSGLAAAVLGYGAVKAFKTALGIRRVGKALFNLGGTVLGSAGGTGILGFGADTAIKLGAGNLAGGASLSAGALSALGLGAVAGGALGATSAISGAVDLYEGSKSDNADEAEAYVKSGALKMGGVGAGAAAGAAIGAAFGGVGAVPGALIGAGIGGIAGIIAGDKVKSSYRESLAAAQEEAAKSALEAQKILGATGRAVQNIHFEMSALNEAVNNSQVSAQQFGLMFQEAVGEKLRSRFGSLKLSLAQVREAAKSIVFAGRGEQMESFAKAAEQSAADMETLKSRMQEIDRLNWEAELGMKMSEGNMEAYKSSMESLANEAQSYLSNRHYEADIAINMLVGEDGGAGIKDGLNGAFEGLQSQIDAASAELQNAMSVAFADGVLSTEDKIKVKIGGVEYEMDEASAVAELQNRIAELTNKVSAAQQDAKLEALKIRFGGAKLDAESFAALQEEMQESVASFTGDYNTALELGIANVRMSLEEGAIDQAEYEKQVKELAAGYEARIENLHMRVESFQLDTIAQAFGDSLDGILPDMEGTVSEKLSEAMNSALAANPKPAEWSQEQIVSWFGLEGLGAETQTAVSGLLQKTAETIPESMKKSLEGVDYSASGVAVVSGVGSAIESTDFGAINSAIDVLKTHADSTIDSVFGEGISTTMPVHVKADYKLLNPTALVGLGGGGSGTATLTANISSNANGGFVNGAQLSWLAEEGYGEFVIPTNPARRDRALQLYEQAGKALGVREYAQGGTAGRIGPIPEPTGNSAGMNVPVTIQSLTFEIHVDGNSAQDPQVLMETIRENFRGMTDEIAEQIAIALEQAFANRPTAAW